tara:strand:- start:1220 stop:1639 length:420 start_codon:yes stop_codon:yes gene_type:complete
MKDKEPKKRKKSKKYKKLPVNWEEVDDSLMAGSTGVEVAAMLGISFDTLSRRCKEEKNADFAVYKQEKKKKGNDVLRVKQYKLAKDGNVPMLIWLGKNRLDQSDKKEIKQQNTGSLININMKGGTGKAVQSENDIKDDV